MKIPKHFVLKHIKIESIDLFNNHQFYNSPYDYKGNIKKSECYQLTFEGIVEIGENTDPEVKDFINCLMTGVDLGYIVNNIIKDNYFSKEKIEKLSKMSKQELLFALQSEDPEITELAMLFTRFIAKHKGERDDY